MSDLEPLDMLELIRLWCITLDPLAVARKYALLQRGGYGADSMPQPSRTSETPMPVTQPVTERDPLTGEPTKWGPIVTVDPFDRELKRRARRFSKHLGRALEELTAAHEQQTWFLKAAEPPEEMKDYLCKNKACTNVHERESSECGRCRKWRHDHDSLPYPKTREEAAS